MSTSEDDKTVPRKEIVPPLKLPKRSRASGVATDEVEGTKIGAGPLLDPTVSPGPQPASPAGEIAGVPSGLEGDYAEEHSMVYDVLEVAKGPPVTAEGPPSGMLTLPRSPTLDSLIMMADALPPLPGYTARGGGIGSIRFERPSITGVDALSDDSSTNLWSFVGATSGGAEVNEEGVIAGRYRIMDDIGSGGMARIYKVNHIHLGKEFALKIIHPEMSGQARLRRAFFREAQVASQFEHPNIVKVTDFGADERRGAYIVMEYLRGETLHARIRRERQLRLPVALDVALQIAEAVRYMHENAVIHCDLKSENIFLCENPGEGRRRAMVKLIDFGLSRTEVLGAKVVQSEVAGTPEYMAPEHIRRVSPQPSIDVYALGILLYEMISGRLPFTGTIEEVILKQVNDKVTPFSEVLDEPLDERACALVYKALEKDPEDRQGSMGQMLYELRTLMDMLGLSHSRSRSAVVRRQVSVVESEGPRLAFDHCPCPLFRLDRDASILAANGAFCDFVREPVERLSGKPLTATRMAPLYPELRADLSACSGEGTQIQHVMTFNAKSDGRQAAALVWIVPEFDDGGACISYTGIIVPYHTISEDGEFSH